MQSEICEKSRLGSQGGRMENLSLKDLNIFRLLSAENNTGTLMGYLSGLERNMEALLQRIHTAYSEYTDHSIWHSTRILRYLELLLGDNINKLSVNEKFCLMAAAMLHDSGMAADGVRENSAGRDGHGERSSKVAKDYFLNCKTPLNDERRFSEAIAFACRAHCMDREALCKDKLFDRVDQISGHAIRYRLIAILLRIGDLLDMEESRTNEYVLRVFRDRYSEENMLHHLKCLNLKVFYVSPEKIQICITVKKIEEYDISDSWLQMLKDEIDFANKYLREDGFVFPEPKTWIEDEAEQEIKAEKVRFEIDDRGTIWDIISRSIYTDEMDFLRELLQNAIDATLAKAYNDEKVGIEHPSPRSWGSENCKDIVVAYSEKTKKLCVCDRGIGMDNRDLSRFLFRITGSGYQKLEHRGFQFPAIAKFGIGFVSCLAHASHIRIYTRKAGTDEANLVFLNGDTNVALVQAYNSSNIDGTTIVLALKQKLYSRQIKNWITNTFRYPSVGIVYVDIDQMENAAEFLGADYDSGKLQKEPYRIGEICSQLWSRQTRQAEEPRQLYEQWKKAEELAEQIIAELKYGSPYGKYCSGKKGFNLFLQDIMKLGAILFTLQMEKELPLDIDKITYQVFKSERQDYRYRLEPLHERLEAEVNNAYVGWSRYAKPFCTDIRSEQPVEFGFDWKCLVIETDKWLRVQKIYGVKKPVDLKGKSGMLFVRTSKQDYQAGLEYDAVAGFCFSDNEIFDYLIHPNVFNTEAVVFGCHGKNIDILHEWNLLSSDCMKWVDDEYEVDDAYESENAYWAKIEHRELGYDDTFTVDLLQIDGNRVYTAENMGVQVAETLISSRKNASHLEYLSDMSMHLSHDSAENPETADYDRIIDADSSRFSQDGIALSVGLETIFPVGLFRMICNCVGDARMSLNVTRHKISELDDDLSDWVRKIGQPMQEEIISSIKNTIAACGLTCELNKLQIRENTEENPLARYFYDTFLRATK